MQYSDLIICQSSFSDKISYPQTPSAHILNPYSPGKQMGRGSVTPGAGGPWARGSAGRSAACRCGTTAPCRSTAHTPTAWWGMPAPCTCTSLQWKGARKAEAIMDSHWEKPHARWCGRGKQKMAHPLLLDIALFVSAEHKEMHA